MPQVSVIIPVYDREDQVKDAVESVFCQKTDDMQIIVVDDGSSVPVSRALCGYLPRINLIRHPYNMGVSAARNTGAKHAEGKYLAFLDSDDIWLESKILKQLDKMKREGTRISHTDEFWWRKDRFINSGKKHIKYGGFIFGKILDKCRVSPSSFVIDRDVYFENGGFNEKLRVCEDYEFFIRLASKYAFSYCDEKLIIKRAVCENSLSAGIVHIESIRLQILRELLKTNDFTKEQLALIEAELARKNIIVKNGNI